MDGAKAAIYQDLNEKQYVIVKVQPGLAAAASSRLWLEYTRCSGFMQEDWGNWLQAARGGAARETRFRRIGPAEPGRGRARHCASGARFLPPSLPPDGDRGQPIGLEVFDPDRVIAPAQIDVSV